MAAVVEVYVAEAYFDAMLIAIKDRAVEVILIPDLPMTEEDTSRAVDSALARGNVLVTGPVTDGDDRVIVVEEVTGIFGLDTGTANAVALLDEEGAVIYAVLTTGTGDKDIEVDVPIAIESWCIRAVAPVSGCVLPIVD